VVFVQNRLARIEPQTLNRIIVDHQWCWRFVG